MSATTQPFESAESRALIRERDEALRGRDGVSVVIPCFNQGHCLTGALDSVLLQTKPALEVIVIDDGSTEQQTFIQEQTLARNTEDAARGTHFHYVRVTNRHLAAARNAGLMLCRGRAFLPLDADDWIDPTFIERTLPLLDDHDVVAVGLQEHGAREGRYNPGFDIPFEDVTEAHLWQMNRLFYCCLFRTDLLRSVGGYNPLMRWGWEDYDLHVDLFRRGARYAAVNEPLFHYRTSDDGMMARCARDHREELMAEMRRHHLA